MYLGDFIEDATVNLFFTTHNMNGAAVAPSSGFEAADLIIYKNNSATQKTSTNGVTMTSPFDSVTGLHQVSIDTSNDTGDAGFWVVGADYTVVLSPDETVDLQTVVRVIGQFSIENRGVSVTMANDIADALLDRSNGIETSYTIRQALRLILASAAGKLSGAATTTINIRDVGDSKNRIAATVDSDGNRTAITYDVT